MNQLYIRGGRTLEGEVRVQGAKNSVLPILAATLLTRGQVRLEGCPRLRDVDASIRILRDLGCSARWEEDTLAVDTAAFKAVGGFDEGYFMYVEDADLTQKMRTRGKAYLVPQYTAIHAWHRAAHRSLKPFLWQLRSLLRYFSTWGFAW